MILFGYPNTKTTSYDKRDYFESSDKMSLNFAYIYG